MLVEKSRVEKISDSETDAILEEGRYIQNIFTGNNIVKTLVIYVTSGVLLYYCYRMAGSYNQLESRIIGFVVLLILGIYSIKLWYDYLMVKKGKIISYLHFTEARLFIYSPQSDFRYKLDYSLIEKVVLKRGLIYLHLSLDIYGKKKDYEFPKIIIFKGDTYRVLDDLNLQGQREKIVHLD